MTWPLGARPGAREAALFRATRPAHPGGGVEGGGLSVRACLLLTPSPHAPEPARQLANHPGNEHHPAVVPAAALPRPHKPCLCGAVCAVFLCWERVETNAGRRLQQAERPSAGLGGGGWCRVQGCRPQAPRRVQHSPVSRHLPGLLSEGCMHVEGAHHGWKPPRMRDVKVQRKSPLNPQTRAPYTQG